MKELSEVRKTAKKIKAVKNLTEIEHSDGQQVLRKFFVGCYWVKSFHGDPPAFCRGHRGVSFLCSIFSTHHMLQSSSSLSSNK